MIDRSPAVQKKNNENCVVPLVKQKKKNQKKKHTARLSSTPLFDAELIHSAGLERAPVKRPCVLRSQRETHMKALLSCRLAVSRMKQMILCRLETVIITEAGSGRDEWTEEQETNKAFGTGNPRADSCEACVFARENNIKTPQRAVANTPGRFGTPAEDAACACCVSKGS